MSLLRWRWGWARAGPYVALVLVAAGYVVDRLTFAPANIELVGV